MLAMKTVLTITLLLFLAGCAGPASRWTRAGTDGEQATTDERRCRNQASQQTRSRYRTDADILTDRSAGGTPFGSTSPMSSMERDRLAADRQAYNDEAIAGCMGALGYSRAR